MMFRVEDLYFAYDEKERRIFDGLSFETNDAFTGIIGVNGAGKTTLVKLSLGLLRPEKGRIILNDMNLTDINEREHVNIGVLHEYTQFPSWVKVLDHLLFVGRMRGLSKQESLEQASILLHLFSLEDRWDSYVSELSAGLRQRFGLTQAFMGLPELVFLDEPTANLDAQSRVHALEIIKEITEEHEIQVVLFSHILADLEKYCDSVLIMHNGEIKLQESMADLLKNHEIEQYVLRFSDAEHKNMLEAILHEKGVQVLSESQYSLIVRVSPEKHHELFPVMQQHATSVNPYKTVLEQVFEDMIQDPN